MTALSFDIFYVDHGAERGLGQLGDKLDKTHGRMDKFKAMALGFGVAAPGQSPRETAAIVAREFAWTG